MAQTVTPINNYMFVSELSRLSFRIDSDSCTFVISRGGKEVFKQTYVPDEDKTVTIYDLDKLLETLIADIYDTFTFLVNGSALGQSNVKVFRCNKSVAESAQKFIPDFFLTAAMGERNTCVGRYEVLTLYSDTEVAVQAICTYVDADKKVESLTETITNLTGWSLINVSPSRFEKPEKGTLVAYTIAAGKRRARYRVFPSLPEADPVVMFRNAFNAWETLYLTGAKETSGSFTRSAAMIEGRYRVYDIEAVISHKAMTGPLRPGELCVAVDLCTSKDVYLLNADGTAGDEITITAADIKHTNEDNNLRNINITYRLADRRNARIEVVRPPRIFDDTFDSTYE